MRSACLEHRSGLKRVFVFFCLGHSLKIQEAPGKQYKLAARVAPKSLEKTTADANRLKVPIAMPDKGEEIKMLREVSLQEWMN